MNDLPQKAAFVIGRHVEMIESDLPGLLDSCYVYGSISLGAFDYGFSDSTLSRFSIKNRMSRQSIP